MKKTLAFILWILFISHVIYAQTSKFTYTGNVQTYAVPAGITSVIVDARGACGGNNSYSGTTPSFNRGGYGGRVVCALAVTPGQVLFVSVGGNGDSINFIYGGPGGGNGLGGWNGGGSGSNSNSAGGGGASDIRIGGTALSNRVVVAGGGAGAGAWGPYTTNRNKGGNGGGLTGENGWYDSTVAPATTYPGYGGTQTSGGSEGYNATLAYTSIMDGTLGVGGNGYLFIQAAGGGGGYYGGGGSYLGGGGGGSSYTDPVLATATLHTQGYNTTRADTIFITANCSGGVINGVTALCSGSTTALSDTAGGGGGTWSSSNTSIATVGSSTGIVTGISAGTVSITYSVMTLCGSVNSIITVTVNPLPSAISGTANVCVGLTTTLSDAAAGGSWSSSNTGLATVVPGTGVVTGVSAGTLVITYTLSTGCMTTTNITVNALPTAITGIANVCAGLTTALTDATTGGTWNSSSTLIATVASSGIVTGISAGTADITYTLGTGCMTTSIVTVNPLPSTITGSMAVCAGLTTALSDGTAGGTWSSGSTGIANVTSSGVVTGVSAGTADITYALSTGCITTAVVTVNALPTISATSSSTCSDIDTLSATGGATYSWSPSTGLSCATCATTMISPTTTTTFTVTGTSSSGCPDMATISINGNRIFGHITFSSYTPDTLDMKVWLIQYNPTDSSINALDSTMTCAVDSITYYEFDGASPGNYMVKAMLLYDNSVGSSGYVPTYGLSTPHWDTATTITHGSGSDSMHITMVNGTVPAGPGFISGYVYSGAGKGTSADAPVVGMIIFIEDAAGNVLSHAYTDVNGFYSFNNLAYADYIIYPENYSFNTIHSALITVGDAAATINNIDFRQFESSKIITPYTYPNGVKTVATNGINIYPNPAQDVLHVDGLLQQANYRLVDMVGTVIMKGSLKEGNNNISIQAIATGVYMLEVNVTAASKTTWKIVKE